MKKTGRRMRALRKHAKRGETLPEILVTMLILVLATSLFVTALSSIAAIRNRASRMNAATGQDSGGTLRDSSLRIAVERSDAEALAPGEEILTEITVYDSTSGAFYSASPKEGAAP